MTYLLVDQGPYLSSHGVKRHQRQEIVNIHNLFFGLRGYEILRFHSGLFYGILYLLNVLSQGQGGCWLFGHLSRHYRLELQYLDIHNLLQKEQPPQCIPGH